MFYEECNQLVTNPLNGGFKEDFSPHVYDEQEGEVQEEGHVNFLYEDCNQHAENNYFPLCFSSFEYLKQRLKASKQAHKLEDMTFSEIDNEKGKKSCHQSQPMRKIVVFHEGLIHKEEYEKGEQLESALHSNPYFYEQEYNHPSVVEQEGHTINSVTSILRQNTYSQEIQDKLDMK